MSNMLTSPSPSLYEVAGTEYRSILPLPSLQKAKIVHLADSEDSEENKVDKGDSEDFPPVQMKQTSLLKQYLIFLC